MVRKDQTCDAAGCAAAAPSVAVRAAVAAVARIVSRSTPDDLMAPVRVS